MVASGFATARSAASICQPLKSCLRFAASAYGYPGYEEVRARIKKSGR